MVNPEELEFYLSEIEDFKEEIFRYSEYEEDLDQFHSLVKQAEDVIENDPNLGLKYYKQAWQASNRIMRKYYDPNIIKSYKEQYLIMVAWVAFIIFLVGFIFYISDPQSYIFLIGTIIFGLIIIIAMKYRTRT